MKISKFITGCATGVALVAFGHTAHAADPAPQTAACVAVVHHLVNINHGPTMMGLEVVSCTPAALASPTDESVSCVTEHVQQFPHGPVMVVLTTDDCVPS